jgi:hypothetical protein
MQAGEVLMLRLFFVSFWTWPVGKVALRGRDLAFVYWVLAVVAALVFGARQLPSLMIVLGFSSPSKFSPGLLVEVFLLTGMIDLAAACFFRQYSSAAAVGVPS